MLLLFGVVAKWMVWLMVSGGILCLVLLFIMLMRMFSLAATIGVISATKLWVMGAFANVV